MVVFFILSKVLVFLINPLTWIIASLLISLFSRKTKVRKITLIGGVSLLVLFSNPLLVNQVLKEWEYDPVRPDEVPLVRTGIMLGGITEIDLEPTDQLHFNENVDRLTESIRLLREGLIQNLIITGGSGSLLHPEEKEAQKLADFLTLSGTSPKKIAVDNNARNTHENAVEVAKILQVRRVADRPVLLITSAFHMRRAVSCFEKQGLTIIAYPVDFRSGNLDWSPLWVLPSIDALNTWAMLFKEWMGFLAYKIMGYA